MFDNTDGIILATTCGFITIWMCNQILISRVAPLTIMESRGRGFVVSAVLMFGLCLALALGLIKVLPAEWPLWVTYGITCVASGLISLPVYFGCLWWSRGMTTEDVSYLPGRVRRLLRVGGK